MTTNSSKEERKEIVFPNGKKFSYTIKPKKTKEKKPRWIGEFAPNLGHDPNNPFPLKKTKDNSVEKALSNWEEKMDMDGDDLGLFWVESGDFVTKEDVKKIISEAVKQKDEEIRKWVLKNHMTHKIEADRGAIFECVDIDHLFNFFSKPMEDK